jgi:hypothetical protein
MVLEVAALGTVLIAKSTDRRADLFAIKPEHAGDNKNAFPPMHSTPTHRSAALA